MHRDTWTKLGLGAASLALAVFIGRRAVNRMYNGKPLAT